RLLLSLEAVWMVHDHDTQYVGLLADAEGADQYVLARLRQDTVAITARFNYTLSPTVSLQVYAQPFASTGSFRDYKQLAEARAEDYGDRFGPLASTASDDGSSVLLDQDGDGIYDLAVARPDFNFRSFRGSAVLRWEYLP